MQLKNLYTKTIGLLESWTVPEARGGRKIIYFTALFLSIGLWRNLFAQFWIIDDHSIVNFLSNGADSLKFFWSNLMESEVGKFADSPRYRPSYYVLYLLECYVWGANPFFWYLDRLLMAGAFVYAIAYIVQRKAGFLYSVLLISWLFISRYWEDILTRLGPGELYCLGGTGLYLYAFFRIMQDKATSVGMNFLLVLGALAAIGAKENFLLLVFPTLYLNYDFYFVKRQRSLRLAVSSIIIFAFAAFVGYSLAKYFSQHKTDVYGAETMLIGLLGKLKPFFRIRESLVLFSILGLGIVFFWIKKYRKDSIVASLNAGNLIKASILGLALMGSQFVFYNGAWPLQMRYDFPGMLAVPCVIILMLAQIGNCYRDAVISPGKRNLFLIILTVVSLVLLRDSLKNLNDASIRNLERTRVTKDVIGSLLEALKPKPDFPLVIEAAEPYDWELIDSVKRYLRFHKIRNRILLHWQGSRDEKAFPAVEGGLVHAAKNMSDKDADATRAAGANCFALHLRKLLPTRCQTVAKLS